MFGDIEKFAIELKQDTQLIKGKIRIWINNIPIGDFKKNAELIYAVFDAKAFFKIYNSLYDKSFDDMDAEQFTDYVMAEELIWSENVMDLEEAKRRRIYVRFLGDQFDGVCSFFSFCKDNIITWIVWNYKNGKGEYLSFKILFKDYEKANNEYINWFNQTLAKYYPNYVP